MAPPPQPSPSAVEITCEDDPFTLEWEVGGALPRSRLGILVGIESILLMACALGFLFLPGTWGRALLGLAVLVGIAMPVLFLRAFLKSGRARLVFQKDALIWVPGDGRIPQVWRRDEITAVEASPRRLSLAIDSGSTPRERRELVGRFLDGDRVWLGELLKRWQNPNVTG